MHLSYNIIEFWICWKCSKFERCWIRIWTSSHPNRQQFSVSTVYPKIIAAIFSSRYGSPLLRLTYQMQQC